MIGDEGRALWMVASLGRTTVPLDGAAVWGTANMDASRQPAQRPEVEVEIGLSQSESLARPGRARRASSFMVAWAALRRG
jgi:hypothetical protein